MDIKHVQVLPTNLEILMEDFTANVEINFYYKPPPVHSPPAIPIRSVDDPERSNHDVTGSPLEVDLDGTTIDNVFSDTTVIANPTTKETSQLPLTVDEARKMINVMLRVEKTRYHIALCDGNNPKRTVVVGGGRIDGKFVDMLVYSRLQCTEEETQLTKLLLDHEKNVYFVGQNNSTTTAQITKWYFIQGSDLKSNEPCSSTIFVKSFENNAKGAGEISQYDMTIQIYVGYKDSLLHSLWVEYCFIHDLMMKLLSCDENTTILPFGLDLDEAKEEILGLLLSNETHETSEMDFTNLRSYNILDKVWLVLKRCDNVSTLRAALTAFFTEIYERELQVFLSADNCYTGNLVGHLASRRVEVPERTPRESLQHCIDLGLNKLRKDYVMMESFGELDSNHILNKWKQTQNYEDSKRISKKILQPKDLQAVVKMYGTKMSLLKDMHVALHFMFELKNNNLAEELLYEFRMTISSTYLNKDYNSGVDYGSFKELIQIKLHEITMKTNNVNCLELKERKPKFWKIALSTETYRNCHDDTTYLFSYVPLGDCFDPIEDSDQSIYGLKLFKSVSPSSQFK